ncbi:MAG: MBL fold metallo-hydrolase [Pseudothermotoga sp.]
MKVVFLGTASAISTAERDNTSLLIENILIDCPGSAFSKLLKVGYDPLEYTEHVIITHRHTDHLYGLPAFLDTLQLRKRKKILFLYILEEYVELLEKLFSIFDLTGDKMNFLKLIPFKEGEVLIKNDSLVVESFPVRHPVKNVGLKIFNSDVSLVYSSDTEPCETLVDKAKGVTVLIHEATWSEVLTDRKEGHTSVEEAARMAALLQVKLLCLVHLGEELIGREEIIFQQARRYFPGKILIPKDLERLII